MQNTLFLELGMPSRLRQLLTTVVVYPAAMSIGCMVVVQTGLAAEVQKWLVFSRTNASGSSLQATRAHATATWARGSPFLCTPALENGVQGGDAVMTSSPGGAKLQMRSTTSGFWRSPTKNGVPWLIPWYFCTELQMSTLNTTFHPQRVAATCQPPAPAQRSSTLTRPSLTASHVCRRSCGIAWGRDWFAVGNSDDTCRFPAPSPCCSPTVSSGRSSVEACSAVHCGTCSGAGCPRRCRGRLRATWVSLCGVETYSMVSGFRVAMHVAGVVTLRRMFLSLAK